MYKWYSLRRYDEKGNQLHYPGEFKTPEEAFRKAIIAYLESNVIFTIYEETVIMNNKMVKPYIAGM